ncbi:MAG TPA: carboxypeptidase-like regulatory domain-containing protein [Gemmatimonadaceae bacterium]|nr:carboxypeptidase-like regulatory domain-containing protein [Gemmatimonadaceae bacterium]
MRGVPAAAFAVLLTFMAAPALRAQADVIRGRVTGPDSLPLENVTVTATSISGNVNRTSRTDKSGRYTITFPGGEGDYMMSFAAIGYAARRFELRRVADEDILIADTRLQRVNAVLDAVQVTAQRQRPRRNDPTPDPSGTERTVSPADVPANLMGDLAAMAATLPGVQSATNEDGSNGFSVLGLGADQNNVTLNGMMFGGSNLPRDAAVMTSLVTSPYDVSRGGFSGGQLSLRTRSGSNFLTRTGSVNFDTPSLQWTDAPARTLGQEYTNASLGGLLSGSLVYDKAFYNVSYQLGRRLNDYESLLSVDPSGLRAAGVSTAARDSVVLGMAARGIPSWTRPPTDERIGDNGLLFGAIDLTSPSATNGRAINLTFNGSWGRQTPATSSPLEVPAFGGDRTNWRFGVQGRHSSYFGFGVLTETSVGVSAARNEATPYLELPAARVRALSTFADGADGVQTLSLGGNPTMNSDLRTISSQVQNQLSWFSANNKHRLRLTSEVHHDAVDQFTAFNTLGTYTYNSLLDFENNVPSSFMRELSPRQRNLSQVAGGISLGDSYRRTDNLQITYGVRVDGNRYLSAPGLNASLDTLYGLRNTALPNRLYASPRVGFSWTYGTAPQIASFLGAQRGPRAVVRGGVGVFQNLPSTNAIGSAMDNTGLPDAVQQVACVGAAVPIPDWTAYGADPSAIPTQCANGTSGTPFANTAPNVTAFARDYDAQRSVRSNLQWTGPTLNNRFSTSVNLTYSLNLNQPSSVDANFDAAQQFTLAGEDDRPVYVRPMSIVPATGAIASQDARVSRRYSRVTELLSDLRSESYQATLQLSPMSFSTGFTWNAWYTYTQMREQFRGFGSTAGNPFDVAWGRGAVSPHQIGYSLGYNFFDFLRVNWFGQFRSGMRYTPLVASDINGDGYANDRAYIFRPTVPDTAIANGIQALLASGSSSARACLNSQLGHIASRNSCTGPWTSNATMSFTFNPLKVRMPQRASLSFQLSNPLAAADMLLHGSANTRGWGQIPVLDPALLYVRGFDAANQRFLYDVNRRFGSTNPQFSAIRAPVTLTALLRFDVGPTRERQMLTQQLDRGRRTEGTKMDPLFLRAMFSNGGIPNPLAAILRDQDTLHLTSRQADSIATLNRQYVIKVDQIWSPLIKEFGTLPDDYNRDAVYGEYVSARRRTVDLLRDLAPHVRGLLDDAQRRRLPAIVASYLDVRYLASIRSGTAGLATGSGPIGGFGGGGFGGGGDVRVEIRRP